MDYVVKVFKEQNYDGNFAKVIVNLLQNNKKIEWVIDDFKSNQLDMWEKILESMVDGNEVMPDFEENDNIFWSITIYDDNILNIHFDVRTWPIKLKDNMFNFHFENNGASGNSLLDLFYTYDKMIPIIKEIINELSVGDDTI